MCGNFLEILTITENCKNNEFSLNLLFLGKQFLNVSFAIMEFPEVSILSLCATVCVCNNPVTSLNSHNSKETVCGVVIPKYRFANYIDLMNVAIFNIMLLGIERFVR